MSNITNSPVIQNAITEGLSNASSGFILGTGVSLLNGNDLHTALGDGGQGALLGGGLGLITGTVTGYDYAKSNKIDPWTGAAKGSTSLVKTGTQFSKHSLERLAQRGVTPKMANTAINKGLKFYDPKNGSINYVLKNGFASGKSLLVGTNPLTGNVTTVIRSSKNLVKTRFIPIQ